MIDAIKELLANKWVFALFTLIIFYAIAKLIHILLAKYALAWAMKTKTTADDLIIQKTNNFVSVLIFLFGVRIALTRLDLGAGLYDLAVKITYTGITFFARMIVIVIFMVLIAEWGKRFAARTMSEVDKEVLPLLQKIANVLLWAISILMILSIWGVDIGPFLASLGIAGLAIGLAVKDTLANIFGGISLILDRNIKVGHVVKVNESSPDEEIGKIIDIGLRSTKILTRNHETKIVPNGVLALATFTNYSLPDNKLRIRFQFGVEYGSDVNRVKRIILDEIKKMKGILKDPEPYIRFSEMADFSLNFKVHFWVRDYDLKSASKDEALTRIYNALRKHKIGIPFPTRTLYIKKN
ncbi:mechanosensitive ion channel family protein [Candidatus Woesearchaeota archaeon]|nr:mechanosensitive ion channel family protein [Candidatus Woesearchaeota archaeon]